MKISLSSFLCGFRKGNPLPSALPPSESWPAEWPFTVIPFIRNGFPTHFALRPSVIVIIRDLPMIIPFFGYLQG